MLNVCISFDYEIFMGENYVSEEEVLLKPTEKLTRMLKACGVSATFFADVCCPEAYRRLGKQDFADSFDRQLQWLAQQGQDIQLHIHPHWKRATQVGRTVAFPRETFRLHNWADDRGDFGAVQEMIHDGVCYLNRLITPIQEGYRCLAFRAGGYCLQPEQELADILYREGIRIDSSVCQGLAYNGDGMYYDYRKTPPKTNVYISREYTLSAGKTQPVSGGVLEIPVAGYSTFPYRPIASKKNKPMGNTKTQGWGMKLTAEPVKGGAMNRVKQILTATNMVTFDFYSADAMIYMLKRIEKENRGREVFISAIAHPKGQTDVHIENMKRVVQEIQNEKRIKFVSMRQIADSLHF